MRKPEKFIVLDTETANTRKVGNNLEIHSALTYDVGWRVMDRAGRIYDEKSYAIRDVYINSLLPIILFGFANFYIIGILKKQFFLSRKFGRTQ